MISNQFFISLFFQKFSYLHFEYSFIFIDQKYFIDGGTKTDNFGKITKRFITNILERTCFVEG